MLDKKQIRTKAADLVGWYTSFREFWERVAKEAKKVKGGG